MEQITLSADKRSETGKSASRRFRREGRVPAVLYGPAIEGSIPLVVNGREFNKLLHGSAGENAIISLNFGGADQDRMVMLKEIVRDPVHSSVVHVDFIEVVLGQSITVEIPLILIGKAEGQTLGGIVQHGVRKVTVACLPRSIPDSLEVDVTSLGIGQAFHLKDVKLPDGVTLVDDPDITVVSIAAPLAEEEAKTGEEVEEELAKSFQEKEGEGEAEGEKE
ncbi:MAG: 50S ribosomal protein L25/general stress protein Ctc [Thermodesulfobacteriota bacterium]|nr:MAG: 50S ribosomal protein L25/general stress protein Ctc [Thermodesulfobacteriota bacterium]